MFSSMFNKVLNAIFNKLLTNKIEFITFPDKILEQNNSFDLRFRFCIDFTYFERQGADFKNY